MSDIKPQEIPILFLKNHSHPSEQYHDHFISSPLEHSLFRPIFIPVLRHTHLNLPILESTLTTRFTTNGPKSYGGLIITSQRTVEALASVLPRVPSPILSDLLGATKVYVVGPATATAVATLGFLPANIIGRESGSGEALAKVILEDYSARPKPLLFLAGETRRDVIPKTLSSTDIAEASRIAVDELVVYETTVDQGFGQEFEKAIKETDGMTRWIVLFSPAGADVAIRVLGQYLPTGGSFLAVIGPTTAHHLEMELGRRPDVVAEKPSPGGLWKSITEFMGSQGGSR
jgi:uroporphyrinogen-III synthase